jgi:hypothetical protein
MSSLHATTNQKILLSIGLAALMSALMVLAVQATPHAGAQVVEPVISDVMASSTSDGSGASLSWTTDIPTATQVEYGTTTDYGTFSALSDASTTVVSHTLTLASLTPNTTYHFAILASDASGTPTVSGDQTFTTMSSSTATSTTATTTPDFTSAPSFCNTTALNEGYFVTTDLPSYTQGQPITFCLADNTRTPLFLTGMHPWEVTDQSGAVVFMPDMGSLSTTTSSNFFTDSWDGMTGSSTSVLPGTYMIVFPGFPGSPSATFTILSASTTSTSTPTTPSTSGSQSDLITQLQILQGNFPNWSGQIQGLIDQILGNTGTTTGTTTPVSANTSSGTIDQNGQTFTAGGSIDFGGHTFGHEQDVTISLNGSTVAVAHADSGGNFSTGSISLPTTPGTYTYVFTEQNSGHSASATITVQ